MPVASYRNLTYGQRSLLLHTCDWGQHWGKGMYDKDMTEMIGQIILEPTLKGPKKRHRRQYTVFVHFENEEVIFSIWPFCHNAYYNGVSDWDTGDHEEILELKYPIPNIPQGKMVETLGPIFDIAFAEMLHGLRRHSDKFVQKDWTGSRDPTWNADCLKDLDYLLDYSVGTLNV